LTKVKSRKVNPENGKLSKVTNLKAESGRFVLVGDSNMYNLKK